MNGFLISLIEIIYVLSWLSKADSTAGTGSWCLMVLPPRLAMDVLSNYVIVLHKASPANIQYVNALGHFAWPIAYHGPFTILLFCSCAWSIDMQTNTLDDLWITKCPVWNSLCTSSWTLERVIQIPNVDKVCLIKNKKPCRKCVERLNVKCLFPIVHKHCIFGS